MTTATAAAAPSATGAPAPARRPRRDAARNHQRVLDAARDLLGELGAEASMEQIAARAGVGVGTVYRRFPSKDSLIDELVSLVSAELIEAGERALEQDDGSGLETFLRAIGRSLAEHRRWAGLLLPRETRTKCSSTQVRAQIGRLLDNAHRAGTVSAQARQGDVMALVWSMRGLIEACGDGPPDAWQRYLDIHLAGLRSPGQLSTTPAITQSQLRELPAPRSAA
jgi:AcrR family transcriptional regulator